MYNPDTLVDAWVDKLSSITDLVNALGGADGNISGYKDGNGGFPQDSNLRRQIIHQPPGTILVVYMGTSTYKRQSGAGAWQFRHQFSFIVKAQEQTSDLSASYGTLFALFVNGIPQNEVLPLLHLDIGGCDGMDIEGPKSQRQQLLVSLDGETLDYFEWTATLIEKSV